MGEWENEEREREERERERERERGREREGANERVLRNSVKAITFPHSKTFLHLYFLRCHNKLACFYYQTFSAESNVAAYGN